jgi:hypothetical protein
MEIVSLQSCCNAIANVLVSNECTSLKRITIFKRSKNTIYRITDHGTYSQPPYSTSNTNTLIEWSSSKKRSEKSARSNECASNVDMHFRKPTNRKLACYKPMIQPGREGGMERWQAPGHQTYQGDCNAIKGCIMRRYEYAVC